MEKLTDKSPLLPLYRTVHEIFTSYGSSFNFFWSHWIRFLVRFENLSPSSIPFRRVTRTNSVTFSCSNWTLSFLLFSKKKIFFFLFTKHMWIQSRSSNKNKKSFAINPFAPFFNNQKDPFQSSFHFFVWNQDSSTAFLFTFFFSFLSSFVNSHKVWSCRIWPISSLSEKYEKNQIDFSIKSTMWNPRFFPLSLSLSRR